MKDLIVIGGGAAGCMAAITAARAGLNVMILDHSSELLKKILVTGNGKCNFTNQEQGSSFYYCSDPAFVMHTYEQFPYDRVLDFFASLGVLYKEKNGYCYPVTDQAQTIRNAVLSELKRLRVDVRTDIGIRKIDKNEHGFLIQTKEGDFRAKTCILATGGKCYPKTGSDGSGYVYARQLGHTMHLPLPALTALCSEENWVSGIAGVRVDGQVRLMIDGKMESQAFGQIQWTDYGISGIPVFQISRFASIALNQKKSVEVCVDFLPQMDGQDIYNYLEELFMVYQDTWTWNHLLYGMLNKKVADMICKIHHVDGLPLGQSKDKSKQKLIRRFIEFMKNATLSITSVKGFSQAQVTCGGLTVDEIHENTMESRLVSGLYFAGEIIDVDGICGGYNLQWAWSSGYAAGKAASLRIKEAQ